MNRAIEFHNNILYIYDHFPRLGLIVVDKGPDRGKYRLFNHNKTWVCDPSLCTGSRYHAYCHHAKFVNNGARWVEINAPWTEWSEQAEKLRLERERSLKK